MCALAVGGFLAYRYWKNYRSAPGSEVPSRWKRAATLSPRIAEAMALRQKMHALLARRQDNLHFDVGFDVDDLMEGLVALSELRHTLHTHLNDLDMTSIDRDAERLSDPSILAQKERVATLRAREERLMDREARAVADLRQIYLELIEGFSSAETDSAMAAKRAHEVTTEVRERVQAEVEADEELSEVLETVEL